MMTPIPAFKTIQTLHAGKLALRSSDDALTGSEIVSREIARTIRSELKQNRKIHLDPNESHFLYKLGYAVLFALTLGLSSRVLAYCDQLNEFQDYADELRNVHNAIRHAIDNKLQGIQTQLISGLTIQIEETVSSVECERSEVFEFKCISIRVVKIDGNKTSKPIQEVEISYMGMSDLREFLGNDVVSNLRRLAF